MVSNARMQFALSFNEIPVCGWCGCVGWIFFCCHFRFELESTARCPRCGHCRFIAFDFLLFPLFLLHLRIRRHSSKNPARRKHGTKCDREFPSRPGHRNCVWGKWCFLWCAPFLDTHTHTELQQHPTNAQRSAGNGTDGSRLK